jgi:hypothetical protein
MSSTGCVPARAFPLARQHQPDTPQSTPVNDFSVGSRHYVCSFAVLGDAAIAEFITSGRRSRCRLIVFAPRPL